MKKYILSIGMGSLFVLCLFAGGYRGTSQALMQASLTSMVSSHTSFQTPTSLVVYRFQAPYLSLAMRNGKAEIKIGNLVLRVHTRKDDKRKYETTQGIVAEVKYKEDGFKLRTPEGQLRWKVKIASDKIKVSDNEEHTNPYEIQLHDNLKVKVKRQHIEVATAKQEGSSTIQIYAANQQLQLSTQATTLRKSLAVLAIADLTDIDKAILFYELWEQGQ